MESTEAYFEKFSEFYKIPDELPLFFRWNFDNILESLTKDKYSTVLDLGTGNGILLIQVGKYNPNSKLIGIDLCKNMIDLAKQNIRKNGLEARLIKSDLRQIPIGDAMIDYVISSNTFHHIEDKNKLYNEIYRILKVNGKLIYSDSHDSSDSEFDYAKQEWLDKDYDFAIKYKESADTFWQSLPEQIRREHPKEYHHPFADVRKFLKDAGFNNVNIIPSPSYFAIISAEK